MNKLLDRLERRYGRYAAPNVTLWLIAGQALVFLMSYLRADPNPIAGGAGPGWIFDRLALDPAAVLAGEWWRLLTFPFLAPLGRYPLFVLFFFYFFYLVGTTLENAWGAFRYNAFLAIGYLATVGAGFLAHAIQPGAGLVVGDFLFGSLFLAFARLNPEFVIYVMLVLPVKIKWLARLQWLYYGLVALFGDWHSRLMSLAAIANVLLFFGADMLRDAKQGHRRMTRQAKTLKTPPAVRHECSVCGLTSQMAPRTQFRYGSTPDGVRCYCPEHLPKGSGGGG